MSNYLQQIFNHCQQYFHKHFFAFSPDKSQQIKGENIALLVYDFDGVMTDNRALQFEDGTEAVFVSRADGYGVSQLKKRGFKQLILSTETNLVVSARGKKLNIEVIQGSSDKKAALTAYCAGLNIDLSDVLYIGNDLNDFEVMQVVGFPVAPADAHPAIIKIAKHVTKVKGGDGVVKELWESVVA
ncbi:MAG: HAD hydrolase family protein [Magnetococcales bacterium]|nr:HAD hydrolase family protein [Magnetococcales bacterium]